MAEQNPHTPKTRKIVKGVSIAEDLFEQAQNQAKSESRSFSYIVCRALSHDLKHRTVQANPEPPAAPAADDLMFTKDVATALKLSTATVVRRAGTPGDVLNQARLRVARKKPLAFSRTRIQAIERGLMPVT